MSNVMESLLSDINKLTQTEAKSQLSFYACQACGDTYTSDVMRETCPGCKATARQWPGSTQEEARDRAIRARGVATNEQPTPAKVPEAPKTAAIVDNTASGTSQPAPSGVNPDRVVTRKRTVKKVKEAKPEVSETVQQDEAQTDSGIDYRAQREARMAAFITKHNLNEYQPVPCGTAVVQTVGYTLWVGGKPIFRFKEGFETGREFAAEYNAARAEQPATRIDVAACSKASDAELEACLYKGDLVVSLNSGHGTEQVRDRKSVV